MDQNMNNRIVTQDMVLNLPAPVQRYMNFTGVVGKPWIETCRLKQSGRFRQGADQPWMQMSVVQTYTTNPPSFDWNARFKLYGLPIVKARDTFIDGHGHMFGKMLGMITLFDSRGEELDQGSMLRYLGEMIWFPTAFLGENITWQAIDDHSAQVTFTDHGRSVSGTMYFDDEGKLTNFVTKRYRTVDKGYSFDTWSNPVSGYGMRAGLNLVISGQAVWNLPSGDLPYWDGLVTEVEYNW
jgi:hypothetical protein